MDVEFCVPAKLEDLLSQSDNYIVTNVTSLHDIKGGIEECIELLDKKGAYFILDAFDTLFSVLYHINDIDFELLHKCYKRIIAISLLKLDSTLGTLLCEDDFDVTTRTELLNMLKMIFFVTATFMKLFQEKLNAEYRLVLDKKGKKNEKSRKHKEQHSFDWEINERLGFVYFSKILNYPLYKLWDPPVVDSGFIHLIAGSCYFTLEKAEITSIKLRPTKDVIFNILSTLIKSYNYSNNCKSKILQLLRSHEHLVTPFAQAVVSFVKNLNCRSMIQELIVEIVEISDSFLDSAAQEGSVVRSFSNFLVEIVEQDPSLVLPSVCLLTPTLNNDPYYIRICTLTIMTEILVTILNSNQLTEDNRQLRDSYFKHLTDHMVDVNVFVRSKVIKLWQKIWEKHAVPKQFVIPMLQSTVLRLKDKSTQVVKYAVQLLRTILENNMYGPILNVEVVKTQLSNLKQQLLGLEGKYEEEIKRNAEDWEDIQPKLLLFLRNKIEDDVWKPTDVIYEEDSLPVKFNDICDHLSKLEFEESFKIILNVENSFPDNYRNRMRMDKNDRVEYFCWLFEVIWKKEITLYNEQLVDVEKEEILKCAADSLNKSANIKSEINKVKCFIVYCEDFMLFIETLTEALPVITPLMMGDSISEVLECIEFFVLAKRFNLTGIDEGIRNMLTLIHCREKTVREAIIAAFKTLYLFSDEKATKMIFIQIVQHLLELLKSMNYKQVNALKEIIKECVNLELISPECVLVLWEMYSRNIPLSDEKDRVYVVNILSMISSQKPELVRINLDLLLRESINCEPQDYFLVLNTCKMFRELSEIKTETGARVRYSENVELFQCSISFVEKQFDVYSNVYFVETAMEIISIIYEISDFPDTTCEKLLKYLYKEVQSRNIKSDNKNEEELLARLILIIGHVAYCHWKYLQTDIFKELTYRTAITMLETEDFEVGDRNTSLNLLKKDVMNNAEIVSKAEKKMEECIKKICENEILGGNNLLHHLCGFVINVWNNFDTFTSVRIKSATALSFSKFMMISKHFCIENVKVYFDVMNSCTDIPVKLNLILAFGDLCCRYPNVIEPWFPAVYGRLADESIEVRYTTLLVISYLVLNEMIKAKAQMSGVSVCIVDKEPKIRNLAISLFEELSQKGNTVYNILPDIISCLCNATDDRISEENFQTIIKILMGLVKEKHSESLIEKLCERLATTVDQRQSADISFCLTLINYSDRCVQKLLDHILCYAEKLDEEKVKLNFTTLIHNCRKQGKVNKQLLDELEEKINVILSKTTTDLAADLDIIAALKTPIKPIGARRQYNSTVRKKLRNEPEIKKTSGTPVSARISCRKRITQKTYFESGSDSVTSACDDIDPDSSSMTAPEKSILRTRSVKKKLISKALI